MLPPGIPGPSFSIDGKKHIFLKINMRFETIYLVLAKEYHQAYLLSPLQLFVRKKKNIIA